MKVFRTISALALAFLVLMSSTSFLVGMHFCMGEVKDLSVFSAADQCPRHEQRLPACHQSATDCCQDKVFKHDGDDFKNTYEKLVAGSPVVLEILQPAVLVSEVIPASSPEGSTADAYDPPSFPDDLTVSLHVFRI